MVIYVGSLVDFMFWQLVIVVIFSRILIVISIYIFSNIFFICAFFFFYLMSLVICESLLPSIPLLSLLKWSDETGKDRVKIFFVGSGVWNDTHTHHASKSVRSFQSRAVDIPVPWGCGVRYCPEVEKGDHWDPALARLFVDLERLSIKSINNHYIFWSGREFWW